MLRMTQAMASVLILFIVVMFILPKYGQGLDASSLSIVQTNDSTEAGVSGYNINYVDDHGDDYDPNMEEFVATKEWKQIKHGQAIPRGLHIRMNLQTGMKEAKLLDENETEAQNTEGLAIRSEEMQGNEDEKNEEKSRLVLMKENMEQAMKDLEAEKDGNLAYWKEGEKEGMMNVGKGTFTKQELKEALKKFKANKDDVQNPENVKNKYRNIEELKDDMETINMGYKSDTEILQELLAIYRTDNITTNERTVLLTELEFHVHQIDNAQDLVNLGGIDLVMKDLNHSDEYVRSEAAFVLGSALQNNPKVQIYALDNGLMQSLVRMLTTEASQMVRNRILYAISSLLRQFPYSQQLFLKQGGLQALSSVFSEKGESLIKLQIRAITLVDDLVKEKKQAIKPATNMNQQTSDQAQEKIRQYKQVAIFESLMEHGWCQLIPGLLSAPDHETREKILVAMTTMMDNCQSKFRESLTKLHDLQSEYKTLSWKEIREQELDLYYTGLLRLIENLIQELEPHKDEL